MTDERLPEDLERAVEGLRGAARGLAERELAGAGPRPDFAEIVARAHRIDPAAVPYGWIDAARRGVPARPAARPRSRAPYYVIGLAAALLLALGLARELASRDAVATPGSLAGLLGEAAQRRDAAQAPALREGTCPAGQDCGAKACVAGQPGCTSTRCPDGEDCGTCPKGQVCETCPAGQDCPKTCPKGQVCETCPAGQDCSTTCPKGQVCDTCPAGQDCSAPCPKGQVCDTSCPKGQVCDAPVQRPVKRGPRTEPAVKPEPPPAPAPVESLEARLRRLDDEAEALLHAGDLAGADDRYVEIVALGGTRPEVEHAFADRFGVARSRRDTAAQRRLWRAYLDRFPGGSFADDAHAGLCRSASDDQAGCWSRYLTEFPAGAHRREAADATEGP